MLALSFLLVSFSARYANAHGFVHSILIGGTDYPGWNPFTDPYQDPIPERVVRKVLNDGFVDASDSDLACHHGGNDGIPLVAEVAAGSEVVFQWNHQGPVSTYMTSCDGDCSSFAANEAKWFKLDASGHDPSTKLWAADVLRQNNNSWSSTVPSQLSVGQYLVRNEIIALHSGSPQFYPSCSQVRVTGSGTQQPDPQDLVTMQDVYNDVTFPNIYSNFGSFTVPGPAPAFGNSDDDSSPIFTSSPTPSSSTGISDGQTVSSATSSAIANSPSSQLIKRRSVGIHTTDVSPFCGQLSCRTQIVD
ncbi:glycosyl hydrolase family 61-domain-containing protein [Cyathus striatus]|nr:glycosyl hydrolase family 61-domain-containing protein [Cyathus striatus]